MVIQSTFESSIECIYWNETTMKNEKKIKFITPLSSLLAFVPIELWKLYLFQTNAYGRQKHALKVRDKQQNGGRLTGCRIWKDITLQEFMTFFGILIHIYTACCYF